MQQYDNTDYRTSMIYKFQWLCNEITTISHCVYNNAVWLMLCWDFVNNFTKVTQPLCCFISFVACYCREIYCLLSWTSRLFKIISHSFNTHIILIFNWNALGKYTDRRKKKWKHCIRFKCTDCICNIFKLIFRSANSCHFKFVIVVVVVHRRLNIGIAFTKWFIVLFFFYHYEK